MFGYQCEIHFTGESIDIDKRLKSDEEVKRMLLSIRGGAELELRDFIALKQMSLGYYIASGACVHHTHG
jgi:hypothetical protein